MEAGKGLNVIRFVGTGQGLIDCALFNFLALGIAGSRPETVPRRLENIGHLAPLPKRALTRCRGGDNLHLGLRGLAAPRGVSKDRTCHFPAERQDVVQVWIRCRALDHLDSLNLLLGALADLRQRLTRWYGAVLASISATKILQRAVSRELSEY